MDIRVNATGVNERAYRLFHDSGCIGDDIMSNMFDIIPYSSKSPDFSEIAMLDLEALEALT